MCDHVITSNSVSFPVYDSPVTRVAFSGRDWSRDTAVVYRVVQYVRLHTKYFTQLNTWYIRNACGAVPL